MICWKLEFFIKYNVTYTVSNIHPFSMSKEQGLQKQTTTFSSVTNQNLTRMFICFLTCFVVVSSYISVKAESVLLISFIRCFVSIGPTPSDVKYDAFESLCYWAWKHFFGINHQALRMMQLKSHSWEHLTSTATLLL